ncbi:MAG TPA: winged helix-turn-helix transcriptional regulator, partial [Clostridia bacterium]|nr:winged helix-turn-helix transcriptional regulator [Clostridia bacterium]
INETQMKIVELMKQDNRITIPRIAESVGIAKRNVESNIAELKKKGIVVRVGSRKNGQWEVIKDEI